LIATLRRRLPALAALLVVPAVVVATPGLADAAQTRNRADAAAGWLGRQLEEDHLIHVEFNGQSFPDYGLTADTVLALDAAKVGRRAANRATRALKQHVLDYTGGGVETEYYAGSFAKLVLVAAAHNQDPRAFGSSDRSDLVAELEALECGTRLRPDCSAADEGRFGDLSQYGDFSNTLTQSLALIALDRATPKGPSRDAVQFLVDQQCPDGSFPESFGAETCSGSVDATGFAVQALVRTGGKAGIEQAALGGKWLAKQQNRNGSLEGNGVRNANSTALAAQAFDVLDRKKKARKARGFLKSLQLKCGADRPDRGLVRYDRANSGDPVRATAQAVPALARTVLADVSKDGSTRRLPRLAC
jgi:hypothetical protein